MRQWKGCLYRRLTLTSVIAAILMITTYVTEGAAQSPAPSGSAARELVKVSFSRAVALTFAPGLLAEAAGFFKDEGLILEPQTVQGGSQTMAALLSGSVDFGAMPLSNLITAAEQGQKVPAIAPMVTQYASNMVISKKFAAKQGITEGMSWEEKAKRLKGGIFAISTRGSGQDFLWRFVLKAGGLDPERDAVITVIAAGAAAMVAAIKQGQIDGFAFGSPAPDQSVMSGDAIWLAKLSEGEIPQLKGFLYVVIASPAAFIAKNPDVVQRFVNAQQRALKMIQERPKEASDLLYKTFFSSLERNVWDETWKVNAPGYPTTLAITDDAVKMNFQFLGLKEPPNSEWGSFLNRKFIGG